MSPDNTFNRLAFVSAFIAAAAWQAIDEDGDDYEEYEFSEAAKAKIQNWCYEFMDANKEQLETFEAAEAGYCFALSANGHGAGFLDHPGAAAKHLRDASKKYAYDVWLQNDKLEIE